MRKPTTESRVYVMPVVHEIPPPWSTARPRPPAVAGFERRAGGRPPGVTEVLRRVSDEEAHR